jgi:hypothetical protein
MNTLERRCPQCKRGDLIEGRNKDTGQLFYGCSRYPECKLAVADLARLATDYTEVPAPLASAICELTEDIAPLDERLGLGAQRRLLVIQYLRSHGYE